MSHSSMTDSFEKKLDLKIKRTIRDSQLLDVGDKIVVGLSGGADSVMLLHYLKYGLQMDVVACHINHNLRGDESARDMHFVMELCKDWDIPLVIQDVDVALYAQQNKMTIEQAGRHIRYDSFAKVALDYHAQKIATAHTLSDNAETLLFHLVRGTGLKGLCGIPIKRDAVIIRPLIHITRQEVEEYCLLHHLNYVTDSTNLKRIYTRNKIRLEVLPKLYEVNPQVYTAIDRTITTLCREQEYLEQMALEAYEDVERSGELSIDKLKDLHEAIRMRVIARFLDQNDIEVTNDLVEQVNQMVFKSKGKINVKATIFLAIEKHHLVVMDSKQILEYFEQPLELGEFIAANGEKYEIAVHSIDEMIHIKKVYKNLLYIYLDYDKIKGKLVIRQRKFGDKITLAGRGGTRSLKKLFIESKLTAAQKSRVLIFADEESVIAVEGYGVDERVSCCENTQNVLTLIKVE
ncbi:tRNA lysidine(34) synthetase TilS [Paludicola sp. MB14-C6]|uniref:tRNA lysidine(34) synthetase TilS n=1 Tax=Paludihabitans sp. MB14-C6 TaxID=3070656 RepID=UPI0027DDE198|nr:tRNA lysidine(34) synthetase TilS [Paludicola sp. MB14-C6]WMJ24128.1 tRNA lysidine(34) synthetase TilS [Paludicola sp. MB14-C6]